jgi:hypothetical protein
VVDRTIFQGDKTKLEDKTVLQKLKKCGNAPNLDSPHSLSDVLFSEGANKKYGDVVYQFYFRYQNEVVSKDLSF